MSDLDKFVELYKSVGVDVKVYPLYKREYGNIETGYKITLEADANEKVGGYSGFFTTILFDNNGGFICQNIYE